MLLGYRDFYLDGCEYLETRPIEFWRRFQHELRHAFSRTSKPRLVKSISYLKPEEVAYAAYHLGATAIRQKQFRAHKDVAYILANCYVVYLLCSFSLVFGFVSGCSF
jgi:hypothetical protein